MKKITIIPIAATLIFALFSCGGISNEQPSDGKSFSALETELKSKFGENAFYTDLSIGYGEPIGTYIATTVTEDPASLKMGDWNMSQNAWKQSSEISLEIPEGSKATDFMFQLNDQVSLKTLGDLVEKSMKQLTAEKQIEKPALSLAYVKFPDDGDFTKAEYVIQLKPENGGTSFNYSYKLNGEFIEMNY